MHKPRWSASWCCAWLVCCGDFDVPQPSKPACSRSNSNMFVSPRSGSPTSSPISTRTPLSRSSAPSQMAIPAGRENMKPPTCASQTSIMHIVKQAQPSPYIKLETAAIAHCFQRLADVDRSAFERLSRYETALWRQVAQLLFTLNVLTGRGRGQIGLRSRWFHPNGRYDLSRRD